MNRVDPAQGSVSGAMVGRRDELAVLHGFLAEATAQGGAMLLSGDPGDPGDPGVGKSMLLDAAEEVAARQGARVLRAAGCWPSTTS